MATIKRSLIAATTVLAVTLSTALAQSNTGGARPDATTIPMVFMNETYCHSIDNRDMNSQDFYASAADVTTKSGKVIQSWNKGNCCTAAMPWNGSACAVPLICAAGTEAVNGSCVATAASCAAIGMTLINGACGVAAPPPPCNINSLVGRDSNYYGMTFAVTFSIMSTNSVRVISGCTKAVGGICKSGGGTASNHTITNCEFVWGGNTRWIRDNGVFIDPKGNPKLGGW